MRGQPGLLPKPKTILGEQSRTILGTVETTSTLPPSTHLCHAQTVPSASAATGLDIRKESAAHMPTMCNGV